MVRKCNSNFNQDQTLGQKMVIIRKQIRHIKCGELNLLSAIPVAGMWIYVYCVSLEQY